ncbi:MULTISPECIES: hypothetical protein [unclassified Ruegeria]|uniref:hypothetical protein n=1 Tax=unclassified Ruegeria TaxID=2625375 RepID=UPI00148960DD|nr:MULTISPECIES: hypothetical protein [unclassified Ruegeria]NOD63178.1 hypothetical protein [Ruegeria sp. HKCCD6109]NOD77967.1 hypothetical protein [Ruegeria sp. HKCCD4332]NOD87551.1 hypothetical protein [Ruegeria sp. HKCCD4318]NOD91648.1 hypothetical protein [Ruegeria sp. HKCCD4884]NOE15584.1 hypothetical protein [Ruegeria sp. HKCCD4318-2]
MMNWTDLKQDWSAAYARAKRRFPNLRDQDMMRVSKDRKGFEAYLAERHQLTMNEAHEEVEDFLFTEGLNREFTHASLSK